MHFMYTRAHKQYDQSQHYAAVHSESLPRIWNITQVFDGQNPVIRHYRHTHRSDACTSCHSIHLIVCLGRTSFLLVMFSDVPTPAPKVL